MVNFWKHDTYSPNILMIKLLKTDKEIKEAKKKENMFPIFQENIIINSRVTTSERPTSKFDFMGLQVAKDVIKIR